MRPKITWPSANDAITSFTAKLPFVDLPRSISSPILIGPSILVIVLLCRVLLRLRGNPVTRPAEIGLRTEAMRVGRWSWRVHRDGQGPAILFLHGLGANLFCWRTTAARLSERFTVIIPDLPGFGGSSKYNDVSYGLDAQVERLVELMDHLGVRRAFVVGNSMGGNIALWMALKHPDRVRAICAIAPAVNPGLIPPGLEYLHWFAHPISWTVGKASIGWLHGRTISRRDVVATEFLRESLLTYGRQHAAIRTLVKATEAIRDRRLPSHLAGVTRPVMILWGSRDRLVSRAVINALEATLPRAESYVHLGGGHHLQEDEPDWTAEKLTSFFAQIQD